MGSNPECFFEYFSSSNTGLIPHWSLGWWRSVGRLVGWLIELVIIGLVGIFSGREVTGKGNKHHPYTNESNVSSEVSQK
jgi:hypothetical protein